MSSQYEAVEAHPPAHAAAIVALDMAWVEEGIAPFRGCALTERDVTELSSRDDVVFLVLLHHSDDGESAEVVGFAWADIQADRRDILLDTRPDKRMCDLHFVFISQEHRGRGQAGRTLYAAVEQICRKQCCTHIELIADSTASESLLRFYAETCGMSYMFTRLRKELAEAPSKLPPLPIPYAASASTGGQQAEQQLRDMQCRLDASEEQLVLLRRMVGEMEHERVESERRSRAAAAAAELQLQKQAAQRQQELRAAHDRCDELVLELCNVKRQLSRAVKVTVKPSPPPISPSPDTAPAMTVANGAGVTSLAPVGGDSDSGGANFAGVNREGVFDGRGAASPPRASTPPSTAGPRIDGNGAALERVGGWRSPGAAAAARRLDELLHDRPSPRLTKTETAGAAATGAAAAAAGRVQPPPSSSESRSMPWHWQSSGLSPPPPSDCTETVLPADPVHGAASTKPKWPQWVAADQRAHVAANRLDALLFVPDQQAGI
jgi:GNAT superfamily N-acetyltransferase